jgi:hypothetical protein
MLQTKYTSKRPQLHTLANVAEAMGLDYKVVVSRRGCMPNLPTKIVVEKTACYAGLTKDTEPKELPELCGINTVCERTELSVRRIRKIVTTTDQLDYQVIANGKMMFFLQDVLTFELEVATQNATIPPEEVMIDVDAIGSTLPKHLAEPIVSAIKCVATEVEEDTYYAMVEHLSNIKTPVVEPVENLSPKSNSNNKDAIDLLLLVQGALELENHDKASMLKMVINLLK